MSTAAVDSYPSEVNYDASNMISKSLKRSRSCFEEENEEENVQENFEEQCSSSCKKMRFSPAQQVRSTKSRQQQQQTHTATLRVTKEAVCNIKLTLLNQIASAGVENIEKLRIGDFCSKSIINSYRYGGVENMPFQVPEFSIESANDASHVVLSYLRGMIVRKDEVAVIPIGDTSSKHMLLLFETQTLKTGSILDPLEELILHESNLHAILVPKFSVVFDLDETLIKTRLPKDDKDLPLPGEVEFKVFNTRLITMIRSGTDLVLKWASQLFNVHIFTNAVFEYAKEICKVLDPTRTTLLANLNEENESEWRALIKSRGDFDQVEYLPKALGLKDLAKFSICTFSTVVLDDDCNVWKQQDNVLPFSQVVGNNKTGSEFLHKMRTETWTRMVQLKKLQQQQAQQEVVLASQNVEYTIIASQESSN